MQQFATGAPARLRVEVDAGSVAVVAGDRDDVEVDVQPRDPRSAADVEHAERTTVELADGVVVVLAPHAGFRLGRSPAIDVRVAVPDGSAVDVATASAGIETSGPLGSTRARAASGSIRVDAVDDVDARTASGSVEAGSVAGDARVTTASGSIALGSVGGTARLSTASGSARVDDAGDSVAAKTASGSLRVGAASRGVVRLDAASGSLHVGVRRGTAAFLDVRSLSGNVRTDLDDAGGPAEGEETLEVRARTVSGSVSVMRAD